MSVQVKLESDDYKFIKEVKGAWADFKRSALMWFVAVFVGFCIGKIYANTVILQDCRVLGMTRFGDVPMGCRVGEKYQ